MSWLLWSNSLNQEDNISPCLLFGSPSVFFCFVLFFFEKFFWNHCKLLVCNLWMTPHCLLKLLKLLILVNKVIFIWVLLTSSLLHIWWKLKVLVTWSCFHVTHQARILEWIAIFFSGDLPNSGITPRSPAIQADS